MAAGKVSKPQPFGWHGFQIRFATLTLPAFIKFSNFSVLPLLEPNLDNKKPRSLSTPRLVDRVVDRPRSHARALRPGMG
jgi:hypothetical protein